MSQPDGFDRLERLRADAGHIAAVAEFVRDVDRWVEDATDAPLQQYLRFPVTAARRRRYLRDRWLARAAAEVLAGAGIWSRAEVLAADMEELVRCKIAKPFWKIGSGAPSGTRPPPHPIVPQYD